MTNLKTPTRCLCALYLLALVASCGSGPAYDPLQDYEEVDATTLLEGPEPTYFEDTPENRRIVERGRYLVALLGCGSCHTDGALIGEPSAERALAGSRVGVAYTNPLEFARPGIVYPSNLTPDVETGLGQWSEEQIIAALRTGSGRHGERSILVMPWQGYAMLRYDDAFSIARYLKSLEPVRHEVPEPVAPGQRANQPYVHFGVYRSR